MTVVAVAVVSGPIVGDVVVLMWVEIVEAGDVVIADEVYVFVEVGQVLPLLVEIFHLLELIWLMGVLMRVLQPPVLASFERSWNSHWWSDVPECYICKLVMVLLPLWLACPVLAVARAIGICYHFRPSFELLWGSIFHKTWSGRRDV